MCGIAAIFLSPQARSPELYQEIWDCFTQNLLVNEKRGKSATGVAIAQQTGTITVCKRPIAAQQFVATTEYRTLFQHLTAETTVLLGHTRHPTQGSPDQADNNHPVTVGTIVGVHNGHIDNNEELFAQWNLPRQATVDSELIFQVLARQMIETGDRPNLEATYAQLQRLQGQLTFLAFDQRSPTTLIVMCHRNPLSIHYHAAWNALIFSSSYIFLRKTFGIQVLHERLPKQRLLVFQATQLDHQAHHPVALCPITTS